MDFREAQATQEAFDKDHWELKSDDFAKIRHITLHMTTLIGKMGRYCERNEHGQHPEVSDMAGEVVPDLLIYALQLANIFGVDVEQVYLSRLERNRKRKLASE